VPTLSLFVHRGGPEPAPASPVDTAARVYGLELEGLSAEDRDFEIARQFVRFAGEAIARASEAPARLPDPAAVGAAVAEAARAHAPGLMQFVSGESPVAAMPPGCGCGVAEHQFNPTTKGVPHV
jgi:hypothetical protein